jgi:hypothetical protein
MVSFVAWMHDQEKREGDPVGWFACYWRDLENKPRLSSPASIAKHLEDRGLFQSVNGLTEAYDRTLAEFRAVRAGSPLQPVPDQLPGVQDQLPLPDAQEPAQGPAGLAVTHAAEAGLAAAQAHAEPQQARVMTRGELAAGAMAEKTAIQRIEAKLDAIMDTLELAEPDELRWPDWYEQAAVYATAHGAGWDAEAGA